MKNEIAEKDIFSALVKDAPTENHDPNEYPDENSDYETDDFDIDDVWEPRTPPQTFEDDEGYEDGEPDDEDDESENCPDEDLDWDEPDDDDAPEPTPPPDYDDDFDENKVLNEVHMIMQQTKKRGRPRKNPFQEPVVENPPETPAETKSVTSEKNDDWSQQIRESKTEEIVVKEFDRLEFIYKPIKNPNGENTKYYSCHSNLDGAVDKDGKKIWNTNSLCLSHNYRIAHIQTFVEKLKKKVDVVSDSPKQFGPFSVAWTGTTSKTMNVFTSDTHKTIFEAVTGIDMSVFSPVNATMELYVLNSYDGKSSLVLNHVLDLRLTDGQKTKSYYDYFTMSNMKCRFGHRGNFSQVRAGIDNIYEKYENISKVLMGYFPKDWDEIVGSLSSKFTGDIKKGFFQMCMGAPAGCKNLMYLFFTLSQYLHKDYTAKRHIDFGIMVEKLVKLAEKDYQKKQDAIEQV